MTWLAFTGRFAMIADVIENFGAASIMVVERRPPPPSPSPSPQRTAPPLEQRVVPNAEAPPTPTLDPVSVNAALGSQASAGNANGGARTGPIGGGALVWASLPTNQVLRQAYPQAARAAQIEGRVVLHCLIEADLSATCSVRSQTPEGYNFGDAALQASRTLRAEHLRSDGTPAAGSRVDVTVNFRRDGLNTRLRN